MKISSILSVSLLPLFLGTLIWIYYVIYTRRKITLDLLAEEKRIGKYIPDFEQKYQKEFERKYRILY